MAKFSKALVEAIILVVAYELIQHFWRGRALLSNLTDLAIVGVSYGLLSAVAIVLGWGWRR